MLETLQCTNLKDLKPRSPVNLERAMTLQTRLGGHIISGHIDGVGTISSIRPAGIAKILDISAPAHIVDQVVPKGSIAADGISLTVAEVLPHSFTVSLIPHTLSQTTLARQSVGGTVNLETDILGKYVARFLSGQKHSPPAPLPAETKDPASLTREFLSRHGYL
jgi:riboflavin synthase